MATNDCHVKLGRDVYIAPTAYVGGNVTLGDQCTVMHQVTIRGDVARIDVGRRVNIQDGCIVHTAIGEDLRIGDEVSIGHGAVVHCAEIGSGALIGIGAIVLDGCRIGANSIVGAGAVVAPRTIIPDNTLVMGVPARPVRATTAQEAQYTREVVERYAQLARQHAAGEFPNVSPSVSPDPANE